MNGLKDIPKTWHRAQRQIHRMCDWALFAFVIPPYNKRSFYKEARRKDRSGMLEKGIIGNKEIIVTEDCTARSMGSGELPVFATPAMIALIEETAWRSVAAFLDPGQGTVGTKLEISHLAATPMGMKVSCRTELTEVDRRRLVFKAEVFDACGKVGEGTHERFLVENENFLLRARSKAGNNQ